MDPKAPTRIDTAKHPTLGVGRRPSTFAQQLGTAQRANGRQDARSGAINDMGGTGGQERRYAVTAEYIDRGKRKARSTRHTSNGRQAASNGSLGTSDSK